MIINGLWVPENCFILQVVQIFSVQLSTPYILMENMLDILPRPILKGGWTSVVHWAPAVCRLFYNISFNPPEEQLTLIANFLKNFLIGNREKTLESPLDGKEIQPVHSEGDQPWDLFGRNDAKAETPVLCPPHAKSWLIGKDSDAGRNWGQEEKGMTEDEMAGWHHWLDGRESEWTPGVGDGQGGLACCDSWCRKESDTTERLNWTVTSLFIL